MNTLLSNPSNTKKVFWKYAMPGIGALLFNSLYIVVDGIFVSKMLGRIALASVTVVVPVVEILIALSMLISVGAGVIISKYQGEGDLISARKYFNISFWMLIVVSLILLISSIVFHNPIISILGSTPDTHEEIKKYFLWFIVFSPFFMLNYGLCTWLRNDQRPNLVMVTQIIGAVLNIVLDWLFMGPLNMGIAGAAIATGLGPVVGVSLMLPHLLHKKGNLYFEKVKIRIKDINIITLKGIPSFAMEFALGLTTLFCNIAIANHLGSLGLATYGIIGYISLIALSLFLGMSQGTQPLISYYFGAKKIELVSRLVKLGTTSCAVIGVITFVFLVLFKQIPINIFVQNNDISLKEMTSGAINIYFFALFASGINIYISSALQSIERWVPSIFISLSRCLIILVPLLLILPNTFGKSSLWICVPLAEIFTIFLTAKLWMKYGINNSI